MFAWVLQDCGDHTLLVRGRYGRMSPLADRQSENPFFNKERKLKRVEQPFEEVRRAKMGDGETRSIEDLLSDKRLFARIAFRMPIGRSLRQVDDC